MHSSARRPATVGVAVAAMVAGTLAIPAVAADNGTVTATVTVTEATAPEACVLIDTLVIDFGTLDFGQRIDGVTDPGAPVLTITSCSDADQELFVRGTDAVNGGATVSWALSDTPGGPNVFGVGVAAGLASVPVTTTTTFLTELAPRAEQAVQTGLFMPESGDGAGEQMSFDIVWTAALSPLPPPPQGEDQ